MENLLKRIRVKVNWTIANLAVTGLILVLLAVLIVWTDFILRLVLGLFILVIAYVFFHLAYKLWWLKREVEKYFKW